MILAIKNLFTSLRDVNFPKIVGNDTKVVGYDHATETFVPVVGGIEDHGALSGLADDDHTQYLLADGSRTGASSLRQTFTNGLTTGSIRPVIDGVAALQFENAAGDAVLVIDSTNKNIFVSRGTDSSNFFASGGGNTTATGTGNLCIGDGTGQALTDGSANINFGLNTGYSLTSGNNNNNFGAGAGYFCTTGRFNNNFGSRAGYSSVDGESNNNFGYRSAYLATSGSYNNVFGREAGYSVNGGGDYNNNNIFGYRAGYALTTGSSNNLFGQRAGYALSTGGNNNIFGYRPGYKLTTGDNNNLIGRYAGYNLTTAEKTICIGNEAGYNETASSKLHIADNQTLSLIEGTMGSTAAAQSLKINAAEIIFDDLPTSDPTVGGALWNDSGTMKISAG